MQCKHYELLQMALGLSCISSTVQVAASVLVILTNLSTGAGEVVGHPVQPLSRVLADVAIVPIHHYTKHVALRMEQILGKLSCS